MSTGIYKYENKINGKVYIGLSNNIERRFNQHLYDAQTEWRSKTGIDYAIKKYGIENFTFGILELCKEEELDQKERYWISYYDSYNKGYNRTPGGVSLRGEEHPRAILTEQDVWNIRDQYGKQIRRSQVFEPYLAKGISERCLLKVWNCENWVNVHNDVYTEENKAAHKKHSSHLDDQTGLNSFDRSIRQDEIDVWVEEFKSGMTINAIAKKHSRDNGTVEKYINHPKAIKQVKYNGRKVKNTNTEQVFNSISKAAKWAGCGVTTLTRHLTTDCIAGKVPETGEPAHWIELS